MIENIYAAVAEPTAATVAQFSGIPVRPGEDTSAKEEDDWWRQLENVLATTDAVHFIQGRTPPRLAQLEQADLLGYTVVSVPPDAGLSQRLAAVEHNRKVEAATAENKRRAVMLDDHKRRSATALATALDTALRPKAAALLLRMQKKHKDASATAALGSPVYDGHAFIKTMRLERLTPAAPAKNRSYQWHEGQYHSMLATKLPDGCSSQDYADKCNKLLTDHLPYFRTISLAGETLSDAYLEFLPDSMKHVAAEIEDDMRDKGTYGDPDAVMARAKRRVGRVADASVEHARLACAVGAVSAPQLPSAPAGAGRPPPAASPGAADASKAAGGATSRAPT